MKKLSLVLILGVMAWVLPCGDAQAIPLFFAKFEAKYGAGATPEFAALIKETKCNICHVKDAKSKKERSPYGEALHEAGLDKKAFPKDRVENEGPAVEKEIYAAFEKAAAAKSPSGATFGEDIKGGKLPGTK
ncbi:MAG TPA: hypothetical protein VL096_15065 [Pirellulaceae bacterium]|nr:hypothetical protein [Pirellulaceae bacterium]